jgi:hypothetical protein
MPGYLGFVPGDNDVSGPVRSVQFEHGPVARDLGTRAEMLGDPGPGAGRIIGDSDGQVDDDARRGLAYGLGRGGDQRCDVCPDRGHAGPDRNGPIGQFACSAQHGGGECREQHGGRLGAWRADLTAGGRSSCSMCRLRLECSR